MDYKKAYYILFSAITDSIEKYEIIQAFIRAGNDVMGILEDSHIDILKNAQLETEEMYI